MNETKRKGLVISLCDYSGNMVKPWARRGYVCVCFDLKHKRITHENTVGGGIIIYVPGDVREIASTGIAWHLSALALIYPRVLALKSADGSAFGMPAVEVVFAFPPCTDLAISGARWFAAKGPEALNAAMALVFACKKIAESTGAPYFLENPVSRISSEWRKPDFRFDPCDYAGYLEDPSTDAYTKRTCLWVGGGFTMPPTKRVEPVRVCAQGSWVQKLGGKSERTKTLRSMTPMGFAEAVAAHLSGC